MEGININLTKYCTKITRLNLLTTKREEKILFYNNQLLGEAESSLINKNFEEVLYLLFYGNLPNMKELDELRLLIRSFYNINYGLQFELISKYMPSFRDNPLNLVEIALLSLDILNINDNNINSKECVACFIQCFIVCINCFNVYIGRGIILPDSNLSIVENWLMMIGKNYKNLVLLKNFSRMLIAWMECYLPSSSIAARISISARTDFISAIVSGFINCTGKKHTSARIECSKFLLFLKNDIEKRNITDVYKYKNILKDIIQQRLNNNELIYGFGHYVFKGLDENGYDPRICVVRNAIKELYADSIYLKLTELIVDMFKNGEFIKNGKVFKLPPNSDIFWTSFLLEFFNDFDFIPVELISLFTILTRLSGIISHCKEQYLESAPIKVFEINNM